MRQWAFSGSRWGSWDLIVNFDWQDWFVGFYLNPWERCLWVKPAPMLEMHLEWGMSKEGEADGDV